MSSVIVVEHQPYKNKNKQILADVLQSWILNHLWIGDMHYKKVHF
jgi:hemerythrin